MKVAKDMRRTPKRLLDHDPVKLRRKRFEAGLNQKGLATAARMAPTSICELETGRRNASATTIARLAAALNCQPVDLLPDENSELA